MRNEHLFVTAICHDPDQYNDNHWHQHHWYQYDDDDHHNDYYNGSNCICAQRKQCTWPLHKSGRQASVRKIERTNVAETLH